MTGSREGKRRFPKPQGLKLLCCAFERSGGALPTQSFATGERPAAETDVFAESKWYNCYTNAFLFH